MLDNPVCLVFFLVCFFLLPLLLTAEFWRGILYSISNFLVILEMKNTTTCLNVVIDVFQGNNWLLLKVIFRYLTVYAKATFNTNLSMRQLKKALDKIPQLLVFTGFEVCSQKTGNTFSALTLSYSSHSSATNDAYSFFRKSTSVSLTRLASKRMLRGLSNSLTEMLMGPAITWGSRHVKKRTTGSFNGHFSSNLSPVRVRNAWQSSWNFLCSCCVICSFFLRPSTPLFVIIPMLTALLSLLLSFDVTSIFANCVKVKRKLWHCLSRIYSLLTSAASLDRIEGMVP